jgi:hypothetical protein
MPMLTKPESRAIAETYLSLQGRGAKVKVRLGDGTDGCVWGTNLDTAVKVFYDLNTYVKEKWCYERLAFMNYTNTICGFWVPQMHDFNDELRVIEMDTIQGLPFVIDFAKTKSLDPEFSDEVLRYRNEKGLAEFGAENWSRVLMLLNELEEIGIFYLDPHPENIVFRTMPEAGDYMD